MVRRVSFLFLKFSFYFICFLTIFRFSHGEEIKTENPFSIKDPSAVGIEEESSIHSSSSSSSAKEEKPPPAKAQPLITDPPKKLSASRSSKESGSKNEKQRKGTKRISSVKKSSSSVKAQWGVVQTDGAAVYKTPNFDSPVLDYLPLGKKIRISQKLYSGVGGFGAFYKVKLSSELNGYITDVDTTAEFKNKLDAHREKRGAREPALASRDDESLQQVPIFFTRYVGGTWGKIHFTEKFSGRKLTSEDWLLGMRMSGPGTLSDGIPIDFSILFHLGAPSFYSKSLSAVSPSGFFVIGDIYLPYPLFETKKFLLSWGVGMMSVYTRFNLQIKNTIFDSQEWRMGAAAQLGFTYRFGRYAARLESKYYYEKTDYLSYFFTILTRY